MAFACYEGAWEGWANWIAAGLQERTLPEGLLGSKLDIVRVAATELLQTVYGTRVVMIDSLGASVQKGDIQKGVRGFFQDKFHGFLGQYATQGGHENADLRLCHALVHGFVGALVMHQSSVGDNKSLLGLMGTHFQGIPKGFFRSLMELYLLMPDKSPLNRNFSYLVLVQDVLFFHQYVDLVFGKILENIETQLNKAQTLLKKNGRVDEEKLFENFHQGRAMFIRFEAAVKEALDSVEGLVSCSTLRLCDQFKSDGLVNVSQMFLIAWGRWFDFRQMDEMGNLVKEGFSEVDKLALVAGIFECLDLLDQLFAFSGSDRREVSLQIVQLLTLLQRAFMFLIDQNYLVFEDRNYNLDGFFRSMNKPSKKSKRKSLVPGSVREGFSNGFQISFDKALSGRVLSLFRLGSCETAAVVLGHVESTFSLRLVKGGFERWTSNLLLLGGVVGLQSEADKVVLGQANTRLMRAFRDLLLPGVMPRNEDYGRLCRALVYFLTGNLGLDSEERDLLLIGKLLNHGLTWVFLSDIKQVANVISSWVDKYQGDDEACLDYGGKLVLFLNGLRDILGETSSALTRGDVTAFFDGMARVLDLEMGPFPGLLLAREWVVFSQVRSVIPFLNSGSENALVLPFLKKLLDRFIAQKMALSDHDVTFLNDFATLFQEYIPRDQRLPQFLPVSTLRALEG